MMVFAFGNASCRRSQKESGASAPNTPVVAETKTPAEKTAATPPLSPSVLEQTGRMGALVQIPGQTGQQGILIEGSRGNSSNRNYLAICDAPADLKSVGIACQGGAGIEKLFAKRISILPSGLSLFGFSSKSSLTCSRVTDPVAGETFHAIRLKGEGTVPAEEVAALTAELDTIRNQINENQKKHPEAVRQTSERMGAGGNSRDRYLAMRQDAAQSRTEAAALAARQSGINARLKIPIASIAAVEMAAAPGRDAMEVAGGELENTLLATSSGSIRAIRFKGKWLDLKEVLASSGDQIDSVKLDLSGIRENVNLTCELTSSLPSVENSYSMVAVTTFELESQGSGSLDERLASAKPVSFQASGGGLSASRQLEWNGRKTKLWLRVFNDKEPGKLILDEVILLDYPGNFSARWGKPPSPLITLPPSPPNTPQDLVKEQQSIDAKGEVRDLIAAGDGSTVMVQTNQPPYWAPLDLKTGRWLSVPWKATADTLVATQAGKIYLIDRKTRVLEMWGLASGKREGMQLLQLDGPITAVAAPLTDPAQPVLVATETGGYFLDPVKFEVVPSGLDVASCFDAEAAKRRGQTPLDPATLCLRASDDGSLYSFSGTPANPARTSRSMLMLTVDRSSTVVTNNSESQFLASRGRNMSRRFPDHGGRAISVTSASSNTRFPGSSGEIRFLDAQERDGFAIMENPPVLPDRTEDASGYLVSDRRMYLDSSNGVMLLPDGDMLHIVRLNLPEQETQLPKFVFAGETLEIPLPRGTGHKLTSERGGGSEIGPRSIRRSAPVADRHDQYTLKLEWTGELGSQISKDYRIQVVQPARSPEVQSPDGRRTIPLHRRGILTGVNSGIDGFAGSGTVMLVREGASLSVWNLVTSEMILRLQKSSRRVLGDADRIYVLEDNGRLTACDILTGQSVGETDLGKKINSISTGMSSRDALLAVEQEGVDGFLIEIPRDSFKPLIIDLPQETRRRLFIPRLASNASGSAVWSREVAILRDSRAITVKTYASEMVNGLSNGIPDATGQFIVGGDAIIDIGSTPPRSLKISSLPGMEDSTHCRLDESGRYILLSGPSEEPRLHTISLREVREPSKELLKIRCPSLGSGEMPRVISGTNTLIQFVPVGGQTTAVVYDFDVPALIKELSR